MKTATPPQSITVHILHDNTLTRDNRDKFSYLAGRYNQLVKFYNVEELCADKIAAIKQVFPNIIENRFSIAMFYRFFIPQLLPDEDKAIYLDSDIIVNMDINELWQIELEDKIFAAVPEILNGVETNNNFSLCREGVVKDDDYFNSGVLLMDMMLFREEKNIIWDWLKILEENPQYARFADQDTLNYYFSARTLKLPLNFNRLVFRARAENDLNVGRGIYHYAMEGVGADMNEPFNRLWFKHFVKTPWFDVDAIGRLYKGVAQIHGGLKSSMVNLSAMMSGKTRAFFVAPQDVDTIKTTFSVQKNEDIILAENQDSLKKLIKVMKRSQGRKIFFIMIPFFPFNVLINEGFTFGKDFLNGAEFLSGFNSYALIKDM